MVSLHRLSSHAQTTSGQQFGGARPPLHPLEAALVGIVGLQLCFLPWALGTMHVWSQVTSLGLSLAAFVMAMLPRATSGLAPVRALLRFPVFWLGLLLLGYVAVQGLNPAWRFVRDENSWWLEPVASVHWLPSSVAAPFERSNPWRVLVIDTSLWLLVGAVWIGFTRRKSYHLIFGLVGANAAALALLGIGQRLAGATRIFGAYLPSNEFFFSSFIYPNHAGPYFYLTAALAAGLAWRHYQRAAQGLPGIGTARAFTVAAVFIGVAVVFSFSRMSIVLLFTLALALGGAVAWRQFRPRDSVREHREFFLLMLLLTGSVGAGLVSLQSEKIRERFAVVAADPLRAVRDRTLARHAATEMLGDRWLLGWGAGCFRFGFPLYAQKFPEIYFSGGDGRKYWEHAHNDLLEIPLELGLAGTLPLAAILGWGAWQLRRRRFWRNPVSLSAVLGCALVLVHASVDFVFQNPAVLFTWCLCLVSAIRWTDLDLRQSS